MKKWTLKGEIMETKKGQGEPLQAEEYILKMMKKKRLLTGAELGNCLLCRIGYDIEHPTDEFILNTLNHWTSQADFDAYYLRLEIRDFLLLLHNSAVYAQSKGYAESLNITQVIMQIAKQRIATSQLEVLNQILKEKYNLAKSAVDDDFKNLSITGTDKRLVDTLLEYRKDNREQLNYDIQALINNLANETIKAFTDSLTFILNADKAVDIIAEHFNLDLHTYKTKEEKTKRIWFGVDMLDQKRIKEVVANCLNDKIITKKIHDQAIKTIEQASKINTEDATAEEIEEVKQALKELKTQADFIHIREWLIKKLIKTTAFI